MELITFEPKEGPCVFGPFITWKFANKDCVRGANNTFQAACSSGSIELCL